MARTLPAPTMHSHPVSAPPPVGGGGCVTVREAAPTHHDHPKAIVTPSAAHVVGLCKSITASYHVACYGVPSLP